jgi:uncharacterized protein YraI
MNAYFNPRSWGKRRGANLKQWLSLILVFLLWTTHILAQDGNTVQPTSIYVRSGPSESAIAIGALFQGESVTPVNRSSDSAWILVLYGRGTGWIQQNEVTWQTDLAALPVLPPDVTPTARATQPLRLLSPTPAAAQGFVLVSDGAQAIVRAGPSRGFPRVGQLSPGALVEPTSRNTEGDWILIRYRDASISFDGFGWIARDLVQWRNESVIEALPIIGENLTPSPTVPTATEDASIVLAASPTVQQAVTTAAPVIASPSATDTVLPTETETVAPTLTETLEPTVTLNIPTETGIPSQTPIPASVTSELPSATLETPTLEAVAQVATSDFSPTPEDSRIIAAPVTPTPILPSETPAPTLTPVPTEPPIEVPAEAGETNPMIPLIALAGLAVAGGLVYIGAFARAMPELRRYEQGFVRTDCPVCERGALVLEEKRSNTLGIPSVRRTVRCTACRSVLREKSPQHWAYAVDRLENPPIYERFNGREISDDELKAL